jgi:hypothetical protein
LAGFCVKNADRGASRRFMKTHLWGRPAATKRFLDSAFSQGFPRSFVPLGVV